MADAELFARYRDALDTNAALAKHEVERLIAATADMSAQEAYAYVTRNYPRIVRMYGRVAADVARQYYQEQRDEYSFDDEYTATSRGGGDESWYAEDVANAYGRSSDGDDHALTTPDQLAGKAIQRVYERADYTLDQNMWDDPRDAQWAIVPHPGACGFCIMVGSNGFNYHSKASALAQRHTNCKCNVVCDFSDSPHLDGYDPMGLYDIYDTAYRNVRKDVDDSWASMSRKERSKYERKRRSAKDVYRMKRITAEIDRLTGHKHE